MVDKNDQPPNKRSTLSGRITEGLRSPLTGAIKSGLSKRLVAEYEQTQLAASKLAESQVMPNVVRRKSVTDSPWIQESIRAFESKLPDPDEVRENAKTLLTEAFVAALGQVGEAREPAPPPNTETGEETPARRTYTVKKTWALLRGSGMQELTYGGFKQWRPSAKRHRPRSPIRRRVVDAWDEELAAFDATEIDAICDRMRRKIAAHERSSGLGSEDAAREIAQDGLW